MTDPNHPAQVERARIVAWLRVGANFEGWKQGLALKQAADAIERGDHTSKDNGDGS